MDTDDNKKRPYARSEGEEAHAPSSSPSSSENPDDQLYHVDKKRRLSEHHDNTRSGTQPGAASTETSTKMHTDEDPLSLLIASREADVQSAFQDVHRRPDRDKIALYMQGGFSEGSAIAPPSSMFLPANEVFEDGHFYFLDREDYVNPSSDARLVKDVLQNGQVPDPPQFS